MNALGLPVLWVLPILAAMLLIAVALWLLDKSRESPFLWPAGCRGMAGSFATKRRYADLVSELIRLEVDVLVTSAEEATLATAAASRR